uniref:Uncharacterized protein n=1 Tax=Arundo donax TaxID=35708 RepID=A0A0A9EWC2_ARUDO
MQYVNCSTTFIYLPIFNTNAYNAYTIYIYIYIYIYIAQYNALKKHHTRKAQNCLAQNTGT